MNRKKGILFIVPDYHTTFSYAKALEQMGWRCDIYVPPDYPEQLLFSRQNVVRYNKIASNSNRNRIIGNIIQEFSWFLLNFWKYRYHVYYGRLPKFYFFESYIIRGLHLRLDFNLSLALSKILGSRIVYIPTGCHDEELKSKFSLIGEKSVCSSCGYENRCSDIENARNFSLVRRYSNLNIGLGYLEPSEYLSTTIKWKSVDPDVFSPHLTIPTEHVLENRNNLRVYFGFVPSGRNHLGRDIKGTNFINSAINKLASEGFNIEAVNISNMNSNLVRFHQSQCDVVVDQLIYGWWGSTGVEGMSLGKPVVCYLRPEWKEKFYSFFPEYSTLPIIEADKDNIYEVLKTLCLDKQMLQDASKKSIEFSESHFSISENAKAFISRLENL